MKKVVVTGTSSGFGEGAVKAFADNGYQVCGTMRGIAGRNAARKTSLESYSPNISIIEVDVADDESVIAGFAQILNEGPIDILINNAGIMYQGITEAISVAQVKEQMETNFYGPIRTMQAVLPSMRDANSGLIVNCSSILGRISAPFFGTYSATKNALEAYSQAIRYEIAKFGIDIVIVEPGPFVTGLIALNKVPAKTDVLEAYGELAVLPAATGAHFPQEVQPGSDYDPKWVVDALLDLAAMSAGNRPVRKVVGIDWGVIEMNIMTQPIQDRILNIMGLDGVLGGESS